MSTDNESLLRRISMLEYELASMRERVMVLELPKRATEEARKIQVAEMIAAGILAEAPEDTALRVKMLADMPDLMAYEFNDDGATK